MTEIPRRIQFEKFSPAERAIYDAVQAVEAMAADVRLTDAVVLLQAARDSVADYIDNICPSRRCVALAEVSSPATPDFKQMLRDEIACQEAYAASTEPTAGLTTTREHRHTASVLRSMLALIEFREGSSPATPQLEELWRQHLYSHIDPETFSRFLADTTAEGWEDIRKELAALRSILVLAASPATPALDWKRLIKLARRQADEDHMKVFEGTGSDEGHNPHYAGCAHPDCVLVRLADVARLLASQEEK